MPTLELEQLKIICYPDPRLRKATEAVTRFDDSLRRLAERMLELMHAAPGVGLAAPQVGVLKRLFVCNVTGEPQDNRVFVNPRLEQLDGRATSEEGCLSIPDVTVQVPRAATCRIVAQDLSGAEIILDGEGLAARCWQHEFDHLRGRLILDYMSEADRLANRKVIKQLESKFDAKR